jgi:hypothetical protein
MALLDALVAANTPWPGEPTLAQAAALTDDEPLADDWYIPPAWIAAHVGPESPPRAEAYPRLRLENMLFPEMATARSRRPVAGAITAIE